ncbi:MAG: type II toxin-antitoxin system RelE/ParE family toxin [Chitinophagales bacterium]
MNYKVELSPNFKKEAKRLSKKYASLKQELKGLFTELESNPTKGTPIGKSCYKIRVSVASKGKGKSGGARIISFVKVTKTTVILLSIYNKGEQDDISNKELLQRLKKYE